MRRYDVILFGASGFTGRQAATYLTQHAPAGLRWAVAGRDPRKLHALSLPADIVVADSAMAASIDAMVAQTRVVMSTAGPFARYGTPVVDACVRHRTHYADITGETSWIEGLIPQYHARAAEGRVRIVPCCGFDSVPSDLSAFLLATRQKASRVRAYFQMGGGGLNGGTVASVSNLVATRGAGGINSAEVMSMPHFDDWVTSWVGPFFMAPTNTWVVRRSAALFTDWGRPYPAGFSYREFLKFNGPLAPAKAAAATTAMAAFGLTLRAPAAFRMVERFLPKPGTGPSEGAMQNGWFSCEAIGESADGHRARTLIRNQGDAGNRSTVKMLCEAAFCLAADTATDRGGILTPATAFGDHLVTRLQAADMVVHAPH
jgi:short subunit dehydrogenase-like uncharacterized protein